MHQSQDQSTNVTVEDIDDACEALRDCISGLYRMGKTSARAFHELHDVVDNMQNILEKFLNAPNS